MMTRRDSKEKCPSGAVDGRRGAGRAPVEGEGGSASGGDPGDPPARTWGVYVVRCRDDSLYTGSTNQLERRLAAHDAGKGAAYTRGRGPVELVYWEPLADRGAALRREWALKQLSRAEKLALVAEGAGLPCLVGSR